MFVGNKGKIMNPSYLLSIYKSISPCYNLIKKKIIMGHASIWGDSLRDR
jgi:hypothetical protein